MFDIPVSFLGSLRYPRPQVIDKSLVWFELLLWSITFYLIALFFLPPPSLLPYLLLRRLLLRKLWGRLHRVPWVHLFRCEPWSWCHSGSHALCDLLGCGSSCLSVFILLLEQPGSIPVQCNQRRFWLLFSSNGSSISRLFFVHSFVRRGQSIKDYLFRLLPVFHPERPCFWVSSVLTTGSLSWSTWIVVLPKWVDE